MLKRETFIVLVVLFSCGVFGLMGDFDGSRCVDFQDFLIFAEGFNDYYEQGVLDLTFNLDADSDIDIQDFLIFAEGFGECGGEGKKIIRFSGGGNLIPLDYLAYEQGQALLLYSSFEETSDGKYVIYLLTTAGFYPQQNPAKLVVGEYDIATDSVIYSSNFYRIYTPEFVKTTNDFFGKTLSLGRLGDLYRVEVDPFDWPLGVYKIWEADIDEADIENVENFFDIGAKSDGGLSGVGIVIRVLDRDSYILGDSCTAIIKNGNTKENIDIVFVPDGYDKTDEARYKFAVDVDSVIDAMWNEPTVSAYKDKMNIYRIDDFDFNTDCKEVKHVSESGEFFGPLSCDKSEVRRATDLCEGSDKNIIHVLTTIDSGGSIAGRAWFIEKQKKYPLMWLQYNPAGVSSSGIAISKNSFPRVPMHEMAHVVAALPDYYKLYEHEECTDHPCMMCDSSLDFSEEGLCYDKQAIVEYFNQWCKVKKIKVGNPYPNPFYPTRGQVTNIPVSVEYEYGQEPCFALMKVFNTKGIWIDFLVSKDSVGENEQIIEWDGKTVTGEYDPSSVYIYEVSVGDEKKRVRGTVIK